MGSEMDCLISVGIMIPTEISLRRIAELRLGRQLKLPRNSRGIAGAIPIKA